MVQKLTHSIETITTDLEKLSHELSQAEDKAKMHKEANCNQLDSEIEKQKAYIVEQIEALDNEILTKPEIQPAQAL